MLNLCSSSFARLYQAGGGEEGSRGRRREVARIRPGGGGTEGIECSKERGGRSPTSARKVCFLLALTNAYQMVCVVKIRWGLALTIASQKVSLETLTVCSCFADVFGAWKLDTKCLGDFFFQ